MSPLRKEGASEEDAEEGVGPGKAAGAEGLCSRT